MDRPFLMNEGFHMNDAGHLISTIHVDLRDPTQQSPVSTLVKACNTNYAPGISKTLRISKPELFREYGENLIRDPGEGNASRETIVPERIDHPDDLTMARLLDSERNRASELVGSSITTNTNTVRRSETTTRRLTSGQNWWIFCASVEPSDADETDRWQATMPDDYDHKWYIYRPREFARALASMVAEQFGPQGKPEEMKHSYDGELRLVTEHETQLVFHGPVVYVEDPYETISNARGSWDFMVRSAFVKHDRYRDQREYRFLVLTEDKTTSERLDLSVSLGMLGTIEKRDRETGGLTLPAIRWSKDSATFEAATVGQDSEPTADQQRPQPGRPLLSPPGMPPLVIHEPDNVPVGPYRHDLTDLPEDLQEMTTTYGAVQALRYAVGGILGNRDVKPGVASSAWHIEPCIRRLCSLFADPIQDFQVTEDDFIVATLKFPVESGSEGTIVVGPLGTGTYHIKKGTGGSTSSIGGKALRLADAMEGQLKEAGLAICEKS